MEINYQLYDVSNPSNPDINILNLPILEPTSNPDIAQRYRLITLPKGSLKVSVLSIKPSIATVKYGDTVSFTVETTNGTDVSGYAGISRDTSIATLVNSKVQQNSQGIATFQMKTALGNSGTVLVDCVGLQSGARGVFQLTVSASGS